MVLRTAPKTAEAGKPSFEPMDTADVGGDAAAANQAPAKPVGGVQMAQAPAAAAANEPPARATEQIPDDTVIENAAAAAAAAPAPAPAPAAPAATGAVATVRTPSKFAEEVAAMRGACDFAYGNYTVFKGNNGEIVSSDKNQPSLGRWVKVTMLGWDDRFEISPGSKIAAAKDAVAYSKDGETIDNCIGEEINQEWAGRKVSDYLTFLRTEMEYRLAEKRRFIDIACAIHECDSAPEMAGEVVQISLSQSSIPSFSSYQEKLSAKAAAVARGIPGFKVPEDPFTFYLLRESASKGDNTWTKLKVVDKLPAKI